MKFFVNHILRNETEIPRKGRTKMNFRIRGGSTDIFKIKGDFEINFSPDEIVSLLTSLIESALKEHKHTLEESIKRMQSRQLSVGSQRFLSVREPPGIWGFPHNRFTIR
jgi:hypothetical protein